MFLINQLTYIFVAVNCLFSLNPGMVPTVEAKSPLSGSKDADLGSSILKASDMLKAQLIHRQRRVDPKKLEKLYAKYPQLRDTEQ